MCFFNTEGYEKEKKSSFSRYDGIRKIDNNKAIKFYLDYYLKNGNLDESCKLISELKFNSTNDYIDKFKIYCLIKLNKNEEAQILITLLMKRLQNLFGSIFHQIIF